MLTEEYHHIANRLPAFKNRLALLSTSPATNTAVVFVHGFGGHTVRTWNQFHTLIDHLSIEDDWWKNADLFFYGYDSLRASTNSNAQTLTDFLQSIFPNPQHWYFCVDAPLRDSGNNRPSGGLHVRQGPYKYENLVLVGHSEGGVIVRLAMMKQARKAVNAEGTSELLAKMYELSRKSAAEGWDRSRFAEEVAHFMRSTPDKIPPLLQAQLRLFAPAISGSRLTGIYGILNQSMVGRVFRPFIESLRAYKDLEPESTTLSALREETTDFAKRCPHFPGLRASIVWATGDDVVTDQSFEVDSEYWIAGASHTSICKPRLTFMMPVNFVRKGRP